MSLELKNDALNAKDLNRQELNKNPCRKCRSANKRNCDCRTGAMIFGAEVLEQVILKNNDYSDEDYDLDFDSEIVSDLISDRILKVDADDDIYQFSLENYFKIGILPYEKRFELGRYTNSILKELEDFKREMGITADCLTIIRDAAGNILTLRIMLKPDLYAAFMSRLADKNLLPTQDVDQKQKVNYFALRTPLSTTLNPLTARSLNDDEDQQRKAFMLPKLKPKNIL